MRKNSKPSPAEPDSQPEPLTAVPLRAPNKRSSRALERRKLQIEQRRQQIFAAALQCFEKNGYYATSINDIAEKAGISPGLIYQYFSNKQDLLSQVLMEITELYAQEIPRALEGVEDPLLRLVTASKAYCSVVDRRRDAGELAYRESKSLDPDQRHELMEKERQTNELISACVRECVKAGYFVDSTVELSTYRITNMAHAWALKHWSLGKIVTFEQYVNENLEYLIVGLLTRKGWERAMELGVIKDRKRESTGR